MIGRLRALFKTRRAAKDKAALDALKVRYHTLRILLANHERALDRLAKVEAALATSAPADELAARVEDLLAVTFELVDGASRLAATDSAVLYERQLRLENAVRAALEQVETAGGGPSCLPLSAPLVAADVGGKAAGLSLLRRNGFAVPDGFVVTVGACRRFLRDTGLDERIRHRLEPAEATEAALANACAAIRRDILAAALPDWLGKDLGEAVARLAASGDGTVPLSLAARSSALTEDRPEHSFAGQFVSELNLCAETLKRGFLAVMAGAFTERAASYRREAGLPMDALDMAVLVQVMVPAVAAGVVFTVDPVRPDSGRMLISAVHGLGVLAVAGAAPVDVYRVDRDDPEDVLAQVSRKTRRAVAAATGGLRREDLPEDMRRLPVLAPPVLARLARLGLAAEALAGTWSDLEFALDGHGTLWLLQSRPARILWGGKRPPAGPPELYHGGMAAAPGRCLGRAVHLDGNEPGLTVPAGPVIAVLSASEPGLGLAGWQGVVATGGHPADHLAIVAREAGRPMLSRAAGAPEAIPQGTLVVLDADKGRVLATAPAIGDIAELLVPPADRPPAAAVGLSAGRRRVHELVAPLTIDDALDPARAVPDCRTLHDIIRFAWQAATSQVAAGEEPAEAVRAQARRLGGGEIPEVLVVDLGGAVREEATGRDIAPEAVASLPLAALWRGLAGRKDGQAPPADAEPVFVLASRDYGNATWRRQGRLAVVDAVCGPRARGNAVRLRCQDRDPAAVAELERELVAAGFVVRRQDASLTASLVDAQPQATAAALQRLGGLL